jgi:hypothetical protein
MLSLLTRITPATQTPLNDFIHTKIVGESAHHLMANILTVLLKNRQF